MSPRLSRQPFDFPGVFVVVVRPSASRGPTPVRRPPEAAHRHHGRQGPAQDRRDPLPANHRALAMHRTGGPRAVPGDTFGGVTAATEYHNLDRQGDLHEWPPTPGTRKTSIPGAVQARWRLYSGPVATSHVQSGRSVSGVQSSSWVSFEDGIARTVEYCKTVLDEGRSAASAVYCTAGAEASSTSRACWRIQTSMAMREPASVPLELRTPRTGTLPESHRRTHRIWPASHCTTTRSPASNSRVAARIGGSASAKAAITLYVPGGTPP